MLGLNGAHECARERKALLSGAVLSTGDIIIISHFILSSARENISFISLSDMKSKCSSNQNLQTLDYYVCILVSKVSSIKIKTRWVLYMAIKKNVHHYQLAAIKN